MGRWVGIDPGKTGAAALYVSRPDEFYGVAVDGYHLQLTDIDGAEVIDAPRLLAKLQEWRPERVWLERVWAMPSFPDKKTGERRQMGAATSFAFGDGFATCRTTVVLDGWPLRLVTSPVWKAFFGLHGPEKENSRLRAIALMPEAAPMLARKKDSAIAEALLIARYGAAQAWTQAGGALPAAEVAAGLALAANLKARRVAKRQRSAEVIPDIPE